MNKESFYDIIEAYIVEADTVAAKASPWDGLLGMGRDPKKDPCHGKFFKAVGDMVKQLCQRPPAPTLAYDIVSVLLTAQKTHPNAENAQWMLLAIQGYAQSLVPFLTPEDAKAFAEEYANDIPRWDRLPVQSKVLKALTLRSKK